MVLANILRSASPVARGFSRTRSALVANAKAKNGPRCCVSNHRRKITNTFVHHCTYFSPFVISSLADLFALNGRIVTNLSHDIASHIFNDGCQVWYCSSTCLLSPPRHFFHVSRLGAVTEKWMPGETLISDGKQGMPVDQNLTAQLTRFSGAAARSHAVQSIRHVIYRVGSWPASPRSVPSIVSPAVAHSIPNEFHGIPMTASYAASRDLQIHIREAPRIL